MRPDEFPIMDRQPATTRLIRSSYLSFLQSLGHIDPSTRRAVDRTSPIDLMAQTPIDLHPAEDAIAKEVVEIQRMRVERYPDRYSWEDDRLPRVVLDLKPPGISIHENLR